MSEPAQLSHYRILRRIGAGGMAEVFLARGPGPDGPASQVALKTILAEGAAQEGVGLFLDEARVANLLHHENIVETLELGFENDTLFIAMEYVGGPPFSKLLSELKTHGRRLEPQLAAYVGAKVARALDYAHRTAKTPEGAPLELVHRDVSPQNILLGRKGEVKLTDFGVARASIQMHKTRTGQVRGKAAYMAPEQVRAKALDGRTDMFALGLVLYEALSGQRPYQRRTDIDSMRAILNEPVPPLAELNPEVPEAMVEIIERALAKKREQRFEDCEAMAQALNRAAGASDAVLARRLAKLIDELFGQEQVDDHEINEPWQPTIVKSESMMPKPMPADMSSEVQALLRSQGQLPVMNLGVQTIEDPTKLASRDPTTQPSAVMAQSVGVDALYGTGSRESPRRFALILAVVAVAATAGGVGVGAVLFGGRPAAVESRAVLVPPSPPPPAPSAPTAAPNPTVAAGPEAPAPKEELAAPPEPERPSKAKVSARPKGAKVARPEPPAPEPAAAPAPVPEPPPGPGLKEELLDLKKRAKAEAPELQERLGQLMLDLSLGKSLGPDDLAFVKEARRRLK